MDHPIDSPLPMILETPLNRVAVSSQVRIANALHEGCWVCRSELARLCIRRTRKGTDTVVLQCCGCGRQVRDAMPLADHPERLGYAIWDQALNEEHHPGGETDSAPSSPDEKQISTALRRQLERLALANRCIWRAEVLLEFWTHATNAKMQRGRVDYLACLDDGPLIGFEVKRRPEQAADLGRFWLQAHDYARSIIVPHPALPPGWAKRPVFAVFLALDMREMKEGVANHLESCDRLFGPTRVGFVTHTGENRPLAGPPGLKLWLTGDKWWTERNGYRANAQRTVRSGNGTISVDFENVS